jgi:hypothetical protein
MNNVSVIVNLSRDEALVLFDWLSSDRERNIPPDGAEQKVLWRLEGQLESCLIEIVQADYHEKVTAAKTRLLP